MTPAVRRLILRANAVYIGVAALGGLVFDLCGSLLGVGPQGRILENAPYAAIGFVEAHGLAWILAVLLWRAAPVRQWHLTAVGMEMLLGTANVIFWQMFLAVDVLVLGYVTTGLHVAFAAVQLVAAVAATNELPFCAIENNVYGNAHDARDDARAIA